MKKAADVSGKEGVPECSPRVAHAPASPPAGGTPLSGTRPLVRPAPPVPAAQRAELRAAYQLEPDDLEAVRTSLERHFGHPLQLDVIHDPAVIGGVWVRVGDIVIDGSLRGRLEALRHHLRAQCQVMVSSGLVDYGDGPSAS